jgi:hypothetical protein
MRADDDGFLNNAKKIMRLIGANQNDYDLLVSKAFIIQFPEGICVIKHWRINNYLRRDRYTETQYTEEKAMLNIKDNRAYTLDKSKGKPLGIPTVDQMETQNRLDKNRLDKFNNNMVEGDNVPKLSSKCPIDIEKDTEIEKEKEIKKKKSPVYFPDDEELEAVFQDYLKLRKKIKAVNSERAINLLGNKLNKMASPNGYFDREIAIQLLNQSIENSWKTIYPLKENKRSNDVLGAIKEYAAERSMNDSRRMYEDARIPQNGLPASNEFFDF